MNRHKDDLRSNAPTASKKGMDITAFLSETLPRVSKPGRYIGGEINSPQGRPCPGDVRVCLAFPEVYEIGMSHQGIAILLSILNGTEGVFAERAFAVWPDMEDEMKRANVPLFSLETKSPLADFDIVGFSLMYELTYTNVVNMLLLSGIPLVSAQRDERWPLIVAGGSCAFNPEPVADLFDAIVVGDGEQVVVEMVEAYRTYRGRPRRELLERLSEIGGVYVPRSYEPRYKDGKFIDIQYPHGAGGVMKRIVPDLNRAPYPGRPIVPHIKAVHDRVSVEIARGCARGCRFCQAGFIYRPVRERDEETVRSLVGEQLCTTGMEEVSLLSLSSGDYSAIGPLMTGLMGSLTEKRIALSVPSLRVDTLTDEMIGEIKRVRKTGFTVAPEAGSERLRAVVNKDITDAEIESTVGRVFAAGWRLIKLYFMIGLPTETDEDLDASVSLIRRIERRLRTGGRGRMNVGISTFIPKPHTPFQWDGTIGIQETRRRQTIIRQALRSPFIDLKFHDPRTSYLEAVFSRGDRRLLGAIVAAVGLGCKFDGWSEHFHFDLWERAFAQAGLSMQEYAEREFLQGDPLPWGHIDAGVSRSFLAEERRKAFSAAATPGCMAGPCTDCGVCREGIANVRAKVLRPGREAAATTSRRGLPNEEPRRLKYLFVYSRRGFARFLSHLEVASLMSRALTRTGVPVNFTEGFHPKPRISFAEALAVGVEALGEPFYVELSRQIDTRAVAASLNENFPMGITVESILSPADCADGVSAAVQRPVYEVALTGNGYAQNAAAERISSFLSRDECWFEGSIKGQDKRINVRPFVEGIELNPEKMTVRLIMKKIGGSSPSPYRVMSALLGVPEPTARSLRIVKESAVIEHE